MSEALASLLAAVLTAAGAVISTAWFKRRRSPHTQLSILSGADLLLTQLQHRVEKLELRVETLERENDAYLRLYGPLPPEPMGS